MPDTLVLLEHAIRSWIELTHPGWDTDVIIPDAFEGPVLRPLGAGFGERLLVEVREPPDDGDVVLIYERGRLRRVDWSDFARDFGATPR